MILLNPNIIKETETLLKEYRFLKKHNELLKKQIRHYENRQLADDGLCGISYDGISISKTYNFSSIVEKMAIKTITEYEEKKVASREYDILLDIVQSAIDTLNPQEKRLIKLYYLSEEKFNWRTISSVLYVSETYCRKELKEKALKNLTIIINGSNKKKKKKVSN